MILYNSENNIRDTR